MVKFGRLLMSVLINICVCVALIEMYVIVNKLQILAAQKQKRK